MPEFLMQSFKERADICKWQQVAVRQLDLKLSKHSSMISILDTEMDKTYD